MRPGLGNVLRFPCPRSEGTENILRLSTSAARAGQLRRLVNPKRTSNRGNHALDLTPGGKASPHWPQGKEESRGHPPSLCPRPKTNSCSVFSHGHRIIYTNLCVTEYVHTSIHTILPQQVEINDMSYFKIILSMAIGTPETVEHNKTSLLMETPPVQLKIVSFSSHQFIFPFSFPIPESNQG